MNFAMSTLVKGIAERQLFVLLRESVVSWLVLLAIVHCLANKFLKISAFSLKSVMKLLLL